MATIYRFFDTARAAKPRQRRRIDWQIQLLSGFAAVCLLSAIVLMYRSHQALAALVPEPTVEPAAAKEPAHPQPPPRAYNADDDVWPWLEPLPATF